MYNRNSRNLLKVYNPAGLRNVLSTIGQLILSLVMQYIPYEAISSTCVDFDVPWRPDLS